MSTAIFLAPRASGGYETRLADDGTRELDGCAGLIVEDKFRKQIHLTLSEGDWEQLRDRINQMMHEKGWR